MAIAKTAKKGDQEQCGSPSAGSRQGAAAAAHCGGEGLGGHGDSPSWEGGAWGGRGPLPVGGLLGERLFRTELLFDGKAVLLQAGHGGVLRGIDGVMDRSAGGQLAVGILKGSVGDVPVGPPLPAGVMVP